ncbi:hypothetical protein [Glycomyces algeriensis]|uniref:Uncharacterized protein n=1 Tax=Glycomyces algeriensis TaxID=256037 RepID=A0A9W6LG49_9ACTN|nr:hypothetical protein [Glycomyces algeriensis]MDA1365037.1 hypothetical protein [Glycomyces algeriensis]MDR7349901.1 hypothetical protein [Glycomyces algeriensis]GLI42612.1 hypothetical protein GALLR39Z86_24620 [Glycomyces algeriensis]
MPSPEHQPGAADEPPAPEPTRPSMEARPEPTPPAAHLPFQPPMYAAAPLPPQPKRRSGRVLAIALVIALMIAGGVVGYLVTGDDDSGSAAEESASEEPSSAAELSDSPSPEAPLFSGEFLEVATLGASVPVANDRWQLDEGPVDFDYAKDASLYNIELAENWYAAFSAGRYAIPELPFSPETMGDTASTVARVWAESSASGGENGRASDPVLTEVTVDGRAGVLAESTASWDGSQFTADEYERIVILLVDVDGVNAFVAGAYMPQSADDEYDLLVDALLATTFA